MIKLRELFKHNTLLKLVSLVIAFVIWLMVVNISNPEITETVTAELTVQYADELSGVGKAFTLDTTNVRISYKVRSNYRRLIHPSDFTAYIDLRDYSVTGAVPVYVEVNDEVSNYINSVTNNPLVVHVQTEDMVERSFPIETRLTGTPGEGRIAGSAVLSDTNVTLYGPISDISDIARAELIIDTEGAVDDLSGVADLTFYDAAGNELSLSDRIVIRDNISYQLPVYATKNLSITVSAHGSPADGYVLDEVITEPVFISVYGPDDLLNINNTINIPDGLIDISEASRNVTVSLNIEQYLPDGLYLNGQGEVSIVAVINAIPQITISEEDGSDADTAGNTAGESEIPETIVDTTAAAGSEGQQHDSSVEASNDNGESRAQQESQRNHTSDQNDTETNVDPGQGNGQPAGPGEAGN